jgi:hypothetical protein
MPVPPFARPGPSGRFPDVLAPIAAPRLLATLPASLRFPSLGGTLRALCICFSDGYERDFHRPGLCTGSPSRPQREATRSPRFLGDPCARAPISDPGGGSGPGPRATSTLRFGSLLSPSVLFTTSASTTMRLSGLHDAARAPAVYASQLPSRTDPRKTRFRLVVLALAGWDLHPRVALKGFSRYMSFSFPRLALAQERNRASRASLSHLIHPATLAAVGDCVRGRRYGAEARVSVLR